MGKEIELDGVEVYKAQAQELKDSWCRKTDLLQQLEAEKLMSHTLQHHLMSKETELAASQAREVQLLDELFAVLVQEMSSYKARLKVEEFKSDETSALQDMIVKSGEVMRKRCFDSVQAEMDNQYIDSPPWYVMEACRDAISNLPCVTLEDLK